MAISFERLISRSVVVFISDELDLAGVKASVNTFVGIAIVGGLLFFLLTPLLLVFGFGLNPGLAALGGIAAATFFEIALYLILEYLIDKRKAFVEGILPEYLQLTAANIRSGISLDRALMLAVRPEFGYFNKDIDAINKQLYGGETMQNALLQLTKKYRSQQLAHTIRMITEAVRYGGGLADLLNQIAKDLRNQQIIQKEVSGQLFMYTIFISFAVLIGAPALYGLTSQMIKITNSIWSGILAQNPGGLPTTGLSFLKPSKPQISSGDYNLFAEVSIIMITGFGSFIVSTIASGSVIRGARYLPIFVLIGLGVFFTVSFVIGGLFNSINTG
jgi:archaeal flagellar protein FlaJ